VSFEEISLRRNLGTTVGLKIFQELISCARRIFNVRNTTLFGNEQFVFEDPTTGRSRRPAAVKAIQNRPNEAPHGKPTDLSSEVFYDYESLFGTF
jgi:hypothetical protein